MALPQYDIVVSFAGEDRPIAEALAAGLVTKGLNVFYDEYAKADLWGKDLYVHLTNVYNNDGKFCLMLLSESYARKQWTSHERRAAQARAFAENTEYILPLRLDSTSIDGILPTTGYVDYHATGLERVIELLVEKVNTTAPKSPAVCGLRQARRGRRLSEGSTDIAAASARSRAPWRA